ncbi:MAG TPA: hypothetical protein VFV30_12570 [Novosphingobium sp.]|nr:hypothetical protein [Novosphingobium sp.]
MIEAGPVELATLVSDEAFAAAAAKAREECAEEGGGRLQRALTGLAGPKIAAAIGEKFRAIDLLPLFIRGWGQSPELAAEADKSAKSSEPHRVRLGKLEQDLDLYPILGLSAWGLTASPIQFTLTLKAEFEAIEVTMEQGYVVQIGGGICRLAAVLKLGQFTFPSGFDPVEWKVGKGRAFERPGMPIFPQKAA